MKQYLNETQTAKLIELGFGKPKSAISYSYPVQSEEQQAYEASLGLDTYLATVDQIEFEYAYSIGELIEMLPPRYNHEDLEINRDWRFERWLVFYRGDDTTAATELIDALYDMIIQLKEEEVI